MNNTKDYCNNIYAISENESYDSLYEFNRRYITLDGGNHMKAKVGNDAYDSDLFDDEDFN